MVVSHHDADKSAMSQGVLLHTELAKNASNELV
jgi:hypothetical protein